MDCADYRVDCDGDSDSDGNRILYRVLNKKRAFWNDFPGRFVFSLYVVMGCIRQRGRKMPFILAIQKILITFAAVNLTTKRHLASWLLLAVFLPMLVFSSLHVHEGAVSQAEKECTDCIHHRSSDGRLPSKNCHAHLTQTATWAHDCVLCQFLTLTMLTAAAAAVTVYIHVCKLSYSQPLCSHHAACCGNIVTRGPPSA